jgi:predicted nuclease of restriction endonuclease-like (RecB) superfamily
MNRSDLTTDDGYQSLLGKISQVYVTGQLRATQTVNVTITETYRKIGRNIVEFEQGGSSRAEYGKRLVASLAADLSLRHGKGFSRSNVMMMKAFYLAFPKVQTLSGLLSWSHYVELLSISDSLERTFYEKQVISEKWSVKELQRKKRTLLFLRLAAGKDRKGILALARDGHSVTQPQELVRDPYLFEFLKIPEPYHVTETDLETRLCDHLQSFLLELGKGFTYIGDNNGNGTILHTFCSGKTLTFFKASTLLKKNEHIHKCVFVVDREDLDRQTREEFSCFQLKKETVLATDRMSSIRSGEESFESALWMKTKNFSQRAVA